MCAQASSHIYALAIVGLVCILLGVLVPGLWGVGHGVVVSAPAHSSYADPGRHP